MKKLFLLLSFIVLFSGCVTQDDIQDLTFNVEPTTVDVFNVDHIEPVIRINCWENRFDKVSFSVDLSLDVYVRDYIEERWSNHIISKPTIRVIVVDNANLSALKENLPIFEACKVSGYYFSYTHKRYIDGVKTFSITDNDWFDNSEEFLYCLNGDDFNVYCVQDELAKFFNDWNSRINLGVRTI